MVFELKPWFEIPALTAVEMIKIRKDKVDSEASEIPYKTLTKEEKIYNFPKFENRVARSSYIRNRKKETREASKKAWEKRYKTKSSDKIKKKSEQI